MTKKEATDIAVSIVRAAFFDNHTAGTMPGSGYSHKVYHEVSNTLGWRDTKKYEEWIAAMLKESNE